MIKNALALKIVAVSLFIVTYILLLIFPKRRAYVALASALIFLVLGILPWKDLFKAINWNVILMLAGTMGLVAIFIESRMPAYLGDLIIKKTPNVKWAIVSLALFAGLISAFVDNVATVIMIAPIAINVAKKLNKSPVTFIIAIAISSNLQGAATLVGDTTSILMGGHTGMTFFDFFVFRGMPGLFFIVQVSAIAATAFLLIVLRKEKDPITLMETEKVTDYFPSFLMILLLVLLIVASLIPAVSSFELSSGIICFSLFIIGLARFAFRKKNKKEVAGIFKEIDYQTLLLLCGLFIIIGGLTHAGIITVISNFLSGISGNVFVMYTILVFASMFLSAFIDNIPYVATMLPVVTSIAAAMGCDPFILYFGLLSGATLGGNLTPIGASANIAGLGILRKEGYEVKALQFMKISVPFTLIAVLSGYGLIWLFYGGVL